MADLDNEAMEAPEPHEERAAPPGSPRRSLVAYLSAYTLGILGDRFGELALPLAVLAATGDPAAAGAVAASIQAPGLVLALWLGLGVDRHPRRRLLILANVGRAAAAAALLANAVALAVSAGLLVWVRPGPAARAGAREPDGAPDRADGDGGPGRRDWGPYLSVFRDPTQRLVQAALVVLSAHGASLVLALVVLAERELSLSPFRLGLVLGAAGVGGLAASAVAARWPGAFSGFPGLALTLGLSAAFLVGLAVAPAFGWALVANALLDGAITAAFITVAVIRQQRTDASLLGRVSAASALCNAGARVIGAAGVGVLLATAGPRVTLGVGAAVLALAAAYVMAGRASHGAAPASVGSGESVRDGG